MKIAAVSKKHVEAVPPPREPHLIVSINDPHKPLADLLRNEHTQAILSLVFHDLDSMPPAGAAIHDVVGPIELYTREQATRVVEFVNQYKDQVTAVLVHCGMGVSRSTGMAAALSKHFKGDDSYFFNTSAPNMRVYRMTLDALQTWRKPLL